MDQDIEVTGELSNAELLEAVSSSMAEEEEDDDGEEVQAPQTIKEKLEMMNALRRFIQENGLGDHLTVSQVEREIFSQVSQAKKQTKITDFFQKSQ